MSSVLELPRRISAALILDADLTVRHVVDLGAGPGAYLDYMLRTFTEARGTWVDGSAAMLELARAELEPLAERITFVVADLERLDRNALGQADVVVTSRALHHLSPASLQATYREITALLTPGGFVFNLDHVGSREDYWQAAYRRLRAELVGRRRTELRPHRQDGPLPPVDQHLEAMAAAGLDHADVPWRLLMTALMVARKPA
jgi:SAM-dependent methyltransferase